MGWRAPPQALPPANASMIAGQRVGPFLVLRDEQGVRHALRLGAVLAASDSDEDHAATVLHLVGNRTVVVHLGLDQVLAWLT